MAIEHIDTGVLVSQVVMRLEHAYMLEQGAGRGAAQVSEVG